MRNLVKRIPGARRAVQAIRRARGSVSYGPRPTILMYHRVAEERFDPWGLAVSPGNFYQQLSWTASNRSALSLRDFVGRHRDGTLPCDAIALTFDDGYSCFAKLAAPLLEHFAIPATVFLPAELVERGRPFWWDELQWIVLAHEDERIQLDGRAITIGAKNPQDYNWRPDASASTTRQKAFQQVWSVLRGRPPAALDEAMEELRQQCPAAAATAPRPMTPAQARKTASALIDVGSHALTHPWLGSLNPEEKANEICDSVERCTALTGSRPASFAYPYGNFDHEAVDLVKFAGFECACTTTATSVRRDSDLFALPRIRVGDCNAHELAALLATTP
jgi:peptidoglycan/xylan/chitin deacetylase (PgdA/CDA1 family)